MRYRNETMLFWLFGYLCFHGKFLRFCRGLKFSGMAVNDNKALGHFSLNNSASHEISKINFAVPADSILQKSLNQNRTPRFLKPGIITSMLQSIPEDMKKKEQFVLSFDGKLIRSGLTKDEGDIDMGGLEDSPTYEELNARLAQEMETVKDLQIELLAFEESTELSVLDHYTKWTLFEKLHAVVKVLTLRMKEIRHVKQGKEFNIKSMIDSVGGEQKWRSSKLVNVISRAKCECVQMEEFIKKSLNFNKKCCLLARSSRNLGMIFLK